MTRVLPGGTIGILGSGQLGRMLTLVARRLGYRVHVLSPLRGTPAGTVADREITADYEDLDAIGEFAGGVDVITLEFENVPAAALEAAARIRPVRPGGHVLHTTQHRVREKRFLQKVGVAVTPFAPVAAVGDLGPALAEVGAPAVLKSATWGYDGKGQHRVGDPGEAERAWESDGGREAIMEAFVPVDLELSVVVARTLEGDIADFGVIENQHERHILDVSVAPARVEPRTAGEAVATARGIVEALDVVGVMCVEFFVTRDGRLLVNELAPRPHNSGHLTIEACVVSQFEQQLRAVCGLPLGATTGGRPAAMANILGDLWAGGEPDWAAACAIRDVALHLYGKAEPRPRRKMGHLTALAETVDEAERRVRAARAALAPAHHAVPPIAASGGVTAGGDEITG